MTTKAIGGSKWRSVLAFQIHVFWANCMTKQEKEVELEEPRSPGFGISTIQSIKDGCMDRSREYPLKY
ncbi:hypothetical protein RO3G_13932 [Rhizopus delemar RA 99-880]|uniref:Uncharacterized protein n=1 Tax=Rhizopus delemar (strain RA 99-880 / ATCC MYA-4621 / FGSC 9543 / NRRL 43880) TaxID=246409 RepID=I1CL91_RHIO9|nr:hypothetical protein RO3G_13932 [Rhizopus delemar RA 99-880]|eukprot:EIE89221.1 hypothetical protein RO3G_13932 [Rhizopus delemar RA 99-880]